MHLLTAANLADDFSLDLIDRNLPKVERQHR